MNFLPVVRRELQVAARKRSTFWVRLAAAVAGLALGGGCLVLNQLRAGGAQTGIALFYALTWTCLAAGLGAGLFFTSDCLSEEKREGTLGLLFLTDMRGYDVGLGKLLATSLRGFYALLAVLPIQAISLGGACSHQPAFWSLALGKITPGGMPASARVGPTRGSMGPRGDGKTCGASCSTGNQSPGWVAGNAGKPCSSG